MSNREPISPALLAAVLGRNKPTDQQARVIAAPPGPLLVVAGAGAGKTETMASRAVWMVANGLVAPEQILGLTFTRKAARQLDKRIRDRLAMLAGSPKLRDVDPTGQLARTLANPQPSVHTYDAYAGALVHQYGLLAPVEPDARLIGRAELVDLASRILSDYHGDLSTSHAPATVVNTLLDLHAEMANHQVAAADIQEETAALLDMFEQLPKGPRQRGDGTTDVIRSWLKTQRQRLDYLPLVDLLNTTLADRGLATFGGQMAVAAALARNHPVVGESQRRRYRVVMLDEYQDTSHAQRVLLRCLFGQGADPELTVNAVGDPMQAIYGWRGATAANLQAFAEDFPTPTGPAPHAELTVSFRNPPAVLDLANAVSSSVLGAPGTPSRSVAPLESFDAAAPGRVQLAWFDTADAERSYVADELAQRYERAQQEGEHFTGAVLVRANKHSGPMAAELTQRGVPVEIVGLGGLLSVPEVADMLAFATLLIRPDDDTQAARILLGPAVGLGWADVRALARRAANLAARSRDHSAPQPQDEDPLERLRAIIAEATPPVAEQNAGLGDAIADLGEAPDLSPEGRRRISDLASRLRYLRTHSLAKPLPELFADIETLSGIRIEVLARQDPRADAAAGTVHLDRLAEEVAAYSHIPGATLAGLLDYFELARTEEDGLAPGQVIVRADRVQILTIHKAKGLEWGTVAVPHTDAGTWKVKVSSFLTNVGHVPSTLRGDAQEEGQDRGHSGAVPIFAAGDAEDRSEFQALGKDFLKEIRADLSEEHARLFYVAITRAERDLLVTGATKRDSGAQSAPYELMELLARIAPDAVDPDAPLPGADGPEEDEPGTEDAEVVATELSPRLEPSPQVADGAALVAAALEQLPAPADGELAELWEADVTALIEEHRAASAPRVDVELPGQLTASHLVALRSDPEQFARRLRRPVPFRPNSYAKRGTAFHQWLEDRFGAQHLLDEDELPGVGEEAVRAQDLDRLKEAFLNSPWAQRSPVYVEHPFEVSIGGRTIRGRIDAIFRDPEDGHWIIVDWKTGPKPRGAELEAAAVQLAVYRVALAHQLAAQGYQDPDIRAAFHYVSWNYTFEPAQLLDERGLEELMARATSPGDRPAD